MTTTIIVVAIVALVFFVAISVVAFMTWRQETQMRTDSLKGIELSLNEVLGELSERRPASPPHGNTDEIYQESFERRGGRKKGIKKHGGKRTTKDYDPFGWADREPGIDVTVFRPSDIAVKPSEHRDEPSESAETEATEGSIKPEQHEQVKKEPKQEQSITEEAAGSEINRQQVHIDENNEADKSSGKADLGFIDIDDLFDLEEIIFEDIGHDRSADYNTGRSGRKYTAEELEALIKE